MEKPEMPSLGERAQLKAERTLSDAELIKGGASYRVAEQSSLEVTEKQQEEIRMEHEGELYPDAASYVKMNKIIDLPTEEVPEEMRKQTGKGWFNHALFYFIDKEGNVARVFVDQKKISSIAGHNFTDWDKLFVQELTERGFDIQQGDMPYEISQAMHNYRQRIEREVRDEKKKGFDF